ncbi:hypothetical protein scyTo_0020202 [Scyliorhinus torazame]|uniref:Uncharacterized protein n=1 Tax=Scyliorhinus torazame TaxID=75743 RepID=A0A401Q202_SCYTO|nr:hypothetical protein [Scyliorhinus torazame]
MPSGGGGIGARADTPVAGSLGRVKQGKAGGQPKLGGVGSWTTRFKWAVGGGNEGQNWSTRNRRVTLSGRQGLQIDMTRINCMNVLRFLVLFIVVIVGLKLFSTLKKTPLDAHAKEGFWGKPGGAKANKEEMEIKQKMEHEAKENVKQEKDKVKEEVKPKPRQQKDLNGKLMRIVHLDLKGAAPKLSYLQQVGDVRAE